MADTGAEWASGAAIAPRPSTARADANLARRLRLVQSMAPSLARDPRAAMSMARLPLDDDALVAEVGRAGAFKEADQAAKAFAERDRGYQQKRWEHLSPLEQAALRAGGYRPHWERAPRKDAGFSLFGLAKNVTKRGVTLLDDVTTVPQAAIGTAVKGLDVAAETVTHAYRTADALGDQYGPLRERRSAAEEARLAKVRPPPRTVLDAWRQTREGEGYFRPEAILAAFEALDSDDADLYAYVAARAAGKSPDEIAESYGPAMGTPEYEQVWDQVVALDTDPKVAKAVKVLSRGKVSPGRDGARNLGLKEGSAPYGWVSAGIDAYTRWHADPTLLAGKALRVARVGRSLDVAGEAAVRAARRSGELDTVVEMNIRSQGVARQLTRLIGDDVNARAAARKVSDPTGDYGAYTRALAAMKATPEERFATLVADHLRVRGPEGGALLGELMETQPHAARLIGALDAWDADRFAATGRHIETPAEVRSYFRVSDGMMSLAAGRAATATPANLVLPRLGRLHALGLAPKRAAADVINFASRAEVLLGAEASDEVLAKAGLVRDAEGVVKVAAEATASPTALRIVKAADKVPGAKVVLGGGASMVHALTNLVPKSGWMDYTGPKTPEVLNQVLGFGLAGSERRMVFNAYMAAADPGARRGIAASFYNTIFERTGVLASEDGAKWAAGFTNFVTQGYGPPGGFDELSDIAGVRHVGLLPDVHRADAIAVPDFKALLAAVHKGAAMRLFYGTVNGRAMDFWMSRIWKPSVLLRIGFIPRAAGEEALAFALRDGPRALLGSVIANTALGPVYQKVPREAARARRAQYLAAGRPDLARTDPLAQAHTFWAPRGRMLVGHDATQPLFFVDWADHIASRLVRLIPDSVLAGISAGRISDAEAFAHYIENRAHHGSVAVRAAVRERIADPDLLEAARMLGARGSVAWESFANEVGSINSYRDPDIPESLDPTVKTRVVGGVEQRAVHGEVETVGPGHPTFPWAIDGIYTEMSHDRVGSHMARLSTAYVEPGQATRIGEILGFGEDHYEAVMVAQRAIAGASPTIRSLLERYADGKDEALEGALRLARALRRYPHRDDLVRTLEMLPAIAANHAARRDVFLLLSDPARELARFSPAVELRTRLDQILDDDYLTDLQRSLLDTMVQHTFASRLRQAFGPQELIDDAGRPSAFLVENHDEVRRLAHQTLEEMEATLLAHGEEIWTADEVVHFLDPDFHGRPEHIADAPEHLAAMADEHGLLVSGGSYGHMAVVVDALDSLIPAQVETVVGSYDRRADLLAKARRGDAEAADQLSTEMALARQQMPDMGPGMGAMETATSDIHGVPVAGGPHPGFLRTYTVVDEAGVPMIGRGTPDKAVAEGWAKLHNGRLGYLDMSPRRIAAAKERTASDEARGVMVYGASDAEAVRAFTETTTEVNGALVDGISREAAMASWAPRQVGAYVTTMLRGRSSGEVMAEVAYDIGRGRYGADHVARFDYNELPEALRAPRYEPLRHSLSTEIVNNGFSYIGRAIDSLVRKPMFLHAYAKGLKSARAVEPMFRNAELDRRAGRIFASLGKENGAILRREMGHGSAPSAEGSELLAGLGQLEQKVIVDWAKMDASVGATMSDIATQHALSEVVPYIDDHRLRSQADVWVRNLVPFMFAETQFLKRWARTLRHSPEAMQKANLIYMGLRHSGWIEKNAYGEDTFVIPGSEPATAALAGVLDRFKILELPEGLGGIPFTGQVRFAAPGADSPGKPGMGPLVGVAMRFVTGLFPELEPSAEKLLGERGVNRSFTDMLFPTSMTRAYEAFTKSTATSEQMASAAFTVMQILEAKNDAHHARTGRWLVPPEGSTDEEWEDYLDRVSNYARVVAMMRFGLGFASPAAPIPDFPKSLAPEFKEDLARAAARGKTFEEALAAFIERHPDATAFAVFSSESISKAPLPATAASYDYQRRNGEFLEAYGAAGPWFLPQQAIDDPYERRARHQQEAMGMRRVKSLKEYAHDLRYAAAAETYFDAVDEHTAYQARVFSPHQRRKENEAFAKWKADYLTRHPTFERILLARDGVETRRRVLEEMGEALARPEAAEAEHYESLKTMYEAQRDHAAFMESMKGERSAWAVRRRRNERRNFANWAGTYAKAHPEVRAFYLRIIRPDLDVPPDEEIDVDG